MSRRLSLALGAAALGVGILAQQSAYAFWPGTIGFARSQFVMPKMKVTGQFNVGPIQVSIPADGFLNGDDYAEAYGFLSLQCTGYRQDLWNVSHLSPTDVRTGSSLTTVKAAQTLWTPDGIDPDTCRVEYFLRERDGGADVDADDKGPEGTAHAGAKNYTTHRPNRESYFYDINGDYSNSEGRIKFAIKYNVEKSW